jgi:uncharacterized repeat protein (TIGR03847 family)
MPNIEIELNPVDFITVGTVGPKGQRVFHLQAGKDDQIVTLTIEKEQANALGDAIRELMEDLDRRFPRADVPQASGGSNMDLREPIEPLFRVAQMGLGYDEEHDMVVLVAQELMTNVRAQAETDDDDAADIVGSLFNDDDDAAEPGVVRLWCGRDKMRLLSAHSSSTVKAGRPDPRQNGRLVYYWT